MFRKAAPTNHLNAARAYAARGKSLTDELPYMAIRRGMSLNRDGSIEFGIRNYPLSAARVPAETRGGIREALRNALIGALPEGTRIRHYTVSAAASTDAIIPFQIIPETDNPVLLELHEAREETLRNLALDGQLSDLSSFFTIRVPVPARPKNASYYESELREVLRELVVIRRDLTEQMMNCGMYCQAMDTQEVFSQIYSYFNPSIALSGVPEYDSNIDVVLLEDLTDKTLCKNTIRDQVANTELDASNNGYLLLDNQLVTTISMRKAGDVTRPGITELMTQALAGKNYVMMNEFVITDSNKERATLNAQADTMQYEQTALNAGRETTVRIGGIEDMITEIEQGEVLGKWASSVILYANNERDLNKMKEKALTTYRSMSGIRPIVGDAQNLDLFLDSAPFGGANHPYHVRAWSRNHVDFVPIVGPWAGNTDPIITLRNPYGGLTGINPASDGVNFGMVVLGEAGSGKTHLMQVFLTASASLGARSTTIDMKDGYIAVYQALGGAIIEIAPGARLADGRIVSINMFDLPQKDAQPTPDKVSRILSLLSCMEINTTPMRRTILLSAINATYARYSVPLSDEERLNYQVEDENGNVLLNEEPPLSRYTGQARFRDLVSAVRNLNNLGSEGIMDQSVRDLQKEMARQMEAYVASPTNGTGNFIDNYTTVDLDNPHTYLRAKGLLGDAENDKAMQRMGLMLLTDLVWTNGLDNPDVPKVNINEEIGVLASIEGAAQLIRKQYKMGREYNFWPVAVSQESDDIAAIKGVANNVSTVLIGSMKPREAQLAVNAFDLPQSVAELMLNLRGKVRQYREYVVVSFTSDGIIEGTKAALYTNDLEMALFSSNHQDKARRDRIQAEHGGSELDAALMIAGGRGAHLN
jgi:conjugal transfer ATP-binding protein TraC